LVGLTKGNWEDMKLLRFGDRGAERPGMVDADGIIRDLSSVIEDVAGDALGDEQIAKLRATEPSTLPIVPAETRMSDPGAGWQRGVAVGSDRGRWLCWCGFSCKAGG
jgi:ureidoglycolate lyase